MTFRSRLIIIMQLIYEYGMVLPVKEEQKYVYEKTPQKGTKVEGKLLHNYIFQYILFFIIIYHSGYILSHPFLSLLFQFNLQIPFIQYNRPQNQFIMQIIFLKLNIKAHMYQYKIIKVIGKGAFGDAYLGVNIKEKKQYVIKQIDINNKSKQQKDHIFYQVKLLQQFNHVNIVYYRDSYIDNKGLLNIVMEYCEGGDMNQLIQSLQGNNIPEDKLLYWLAQIALAIFYLHEKKILHRDLKSPNIFILKGDIRLGDFGISKVLDHVRDLAQTNIGTPYYMSPQQYNHKPYSYKSDIWAFGCILYEMCNQRRPFEANNLQALGMKIVRGNFPPVSEIYSNDLRQLIGEMLQKNPAKRPNIIEILSKPFMRKKLVEYMKCIYSKKDKFSKQSIASFLEQANRLGVVLENKKPAIVHKQPKQTQTEKQRSTSVKKNIFQQEKEKEKQERQRKKQELQKQLNRHNKERKQMAQKLKKVQQERVTLMARRKSQKKLKVIHQKVQAGQQKPQKKQYQNESQKKNEQSNKNLNAKVNSQQTMPTLPNQQKIGKSQVVTQTVQLTNIQNSKKTIAENKLTAAKQAKPKPIQNSWVQDKKAFKMQEEYEMQFQDCQPQNNQHYQFSDDEDEQSNDYRQFQSQNRVHTFANDDGNMVKQVQYIKNLVQASNKAVKQITKKQHKQVEDPGVMQIKARQYDEQQKTKDQKQILQKVQDLKQQIKMKTQHIYSIRNELSNIDFQLSQSDDSVGDQSQKVKLIQHSNFKKKQINPQHAKINDRINRLKQSATTILGSEKYGKFYQYLVTIKQKGRTVKRDYLEQLLGREKIGVYHLVEQIVRLMRVRQKIPKWL